MIRRAKVYGQIGGLRDEQYIMFSEEMDWCKLGTRLRAGGGVPGDVKIVHHAGKDRAGQRSSTSISDEQLRYFRNITGHCRGRPSSFLGRELYPTALHGNG